LRFAQRALTALRKQRFHFRAIRCTEPASKARAFERCGGIRKSRRIDNAASRAPIRSANAATRKIASNAA